MTREIFKTYIIPCNVMDLNKLQTELVALGIGINQILLVGANLEVRSPVELTVEQKTLVSTTLASFVDINLDDKVPLIKDLAKSEASKKHFHNIDYKKELTQAIIPERESGTVQGEVRQVIWYKDMDFTDPQKPVPTNPVIKVDISYSRDTSGFATSRITNRTYYNRDGSENPEVKTTVKYYFINRQDMVDEGIKRRSLLVNSIQIPTMTLIAEVLMPLGVTMDNVVSKGRQFLDDYRSDFSKFTENSSSITDPLDPDFGMKTIIVKLRDDLDVGHVEWLNKLPNSLGGSKSIRQFLMEEFDI